MSLTSIYTELHRQAARTGTDRAQDLAHGARLAVRVLEGVVTLTIARKGKRLGATEIEVFKRDCGVPETAVRFPQEGQQVREREGAQWHAISYRWREGDDQ
jgi:hypothetical protein